VIERELFAGQGLSAIDAKGRVAIPACLRATLEANGHIHNSTRQMVVAPHPESACITGYDRGWLKTLDQRIQREEERERSAGRPFDYYAASRRAFGQAEDVPYDPSGRFIFPAFFKHKGKLEDLAFFFGAGQFFEIWNPRILIANPELNPDAAEGAEYFMREKGLLK
jgi:MraZ protein